ncbi:4,5-DOPA dioxygenase extradiol-like protein [Psilocybe cubensis]|uniref:Extradiol ring-cleavage dioxygenase class III enzyme subunit B domain-containing protein n=2 Tax=Psilocybe cubensis TaxID=181762 RepID=A0A8H8CNZ6_PSICU|nr:4,5-DOPA dioxygenase extradiol-like protein [Psilocybe cubensis]KAH9484173.1 4,5-DOPA dioxygenase extradiol-like protein [Psilocybe cubensis]
MSTSATSWHAALESLPATPEKIPAFFFAHGSPMLAFPPTEGSDGGMMGYHGPKGPLAQFLKEFGPTLLKKYRPKGIVVFSAHWETYGERLVSDYPENPLLMDYYGFPPELYQLKFKSKGDSKLAQHVVDLYKKAGQKARLTTVHESRGEDGRGFSGPGLDHGVFVPFRIMFGEEFTEIPIVQVSIDSSMDPEKNWELGKAVAQLREEGILILAGGLTAHNLRDRVSFSPDTARAVHKEFDQAIHQAIATDSAEERKKALFALPRHPGFRASQPREDHFVPLYVAGGAGEGGAVHTIVDLYGLASFAFGI